MDYRINETGCTHAMIVGAEKGIDVKRLCQENGDDVLSEWMTVDFCDWCKDRRIK